MTALRRAGHATPEQLAAAVASDGAPMALSTVYRNLEALADAGLVAHTHLDHGPPSYHLVEHGVHLHLVCTTCGSVAEADPAAAAALAGNLLRSHGFVADVTHMAIHGHCADCARSGGEPV
jgi:Fur family transcriptional regulator, ferric uptake regulator